MITICFLPSAEHYHAFRENATTITEVHTPLLKHQQDTDTSEETEVAEKEYTSPIDISAKEHSVTIQESHAHIAQEHPNVITYIIKLTQKEVIPDNGFQSVAIPQVQPVVLFPCFQIEPRRSSKTKSRTPRDLLAETSIIQQLILWQPKRQRRINNCLGSTSLLRLNSQCL